MKRTTITTVKECLKCNIVPSFRSTKVVLVAFFSLTGKIPLCCQISKSTVRNILKEQGFDPGPKRGEGTWDEFIKIHAKTLWACDLFSKKVWTLGGLVEYFVLFFIQPGTRRVHIAGITANPNGVWMAQQTKNLCMFFADLP